MSTSLIIYLSLHVLLLLFTAIVFYALLLELLGKKGTTKRTLLRKSILGLGVAILSSVIESVYLIDYFAGRLGFNTDQNTTALIPFFTYTREILFLFLLVSAFLMFIRVRSKGEEVSENTKLKNQLIVLSTIAVVSAAALMFLGVLVP